MRRFLAIITITVGLIYLSLQFGQQMEQYYENKAEQPPLWVILLSSAAKGNLGNGNYAGVPNRLDLSRLIPGDIILAGNEGGAYGKFTHAGLFIGENQAVDMYLSTGVYLTSVETYHEYDWAAILRVNATSGQRSAVINYVNTQLGSPFFILTPKQENGLWYCTKLIWYAYFKQGINLDPFQSYWITPDAFFYSPNTQLIDYATAG